MHERSWWVGTASFGAPYGIANKSPIASGQIELLVGEIEDSNFSGFDTAPSYGNAESLLGESDLTGLGIYSKLPSSVDLADPVEVLRAIGASLNTLGVSSLSGIGMHSSNALFEAGIQGERNIQLALDEGLADQWGVSVYTEDELVAVFRKFSPDFVQVPASILDRRFLSPRVVELFQSRGVSMQVRSVFLQGLLLLEPDEIPRSFSEVIPALSQINEVAQDLGLTRTELAVTFISKANHIGSIVLGVNSIEQFRQLDSAIANSALDLSGVEWPTVSDQLLDPRGWGR